MATSRTSANVEQGQVGGEARRDLPDSVGQGERGRPVYRRRDDHFGDAQTSWLTPRVSTSGRLGVGEVPGLKSVASATGTPALDEAAGGSVLGLAEKEHRSRQERGDGWSLRQRGDSGVRNSRQMVGRRGAQLDAASSAPPEEVSSSAWSLTSSPAVARRGEDRPALVHRVDAGLAKHVGEPRQPFARRPRESSRG